MSEYLLLETIFTSMALAMSLLAVSLLVSRKDPNGIYKPLIIFFSANAYIELTSALYPLSDFGYFQDFMLIAEITSIPAFLLMAPALWFYVRGLTSETRQRVTWRDAKHFLPFAFGVVACSLLIVSPASIRHQIFGDGDGPATVWIVTITLMIILIMLMWAIQVIVYIAALLLRIARYRTRLRDVFASTEGRELKWIIWMIVLLTATIFIIIPDLFIGFPEQVKLLPTIFDACLIWFLAVWGLRQTPGFIQAGETELPAAPLETAPIATKYEKSALTEDDTARIAARIEAAMQVDQLYLDPNLSLRTLSKHIAVQPNYVSQALNGNLGEAFFDYINRWRITHAKPLLATTDETVLNITYDIGFNSRSSFYKAFKRETGQTPSAYRNAARAAKVVKLS